MTTSLDQTSRLLSRTSGPEEAPVLVYLPGIHGDWTAMWRLRHLFSARLRLVELTYPRAPEWSLEDYVNRLGELLDALAVGPVHLLAESFGSLVGWAFAMRHPERVRSLVLAGGFCSTPGRLRVGLAHGLLRLAPTPLLDRWLDFYYGWLVRHGLDPQTLPREEFFPATRTRRGWQTGLGRLRIIRQTDLRQGLAGLRLPVLYLGGCRDLVVPVRREVRLLQRHLHADCVFRSILLPRAPHAILPARHRAVAEIVTQWVLEHEPPHPTA